MIPSLALITSVMGFLSLLSSLIDSTGEVQHRIARAWGRALMRVFQVELRLVGSDRLRAGQAYVFASSHFSLIDTPLMFGLMPRPFRVLARDGLWKIPFIGWHLNRAGHLPVNRANPRVAARNIADAAERVRSGRSILLFPEGGRRRSDAPRPFKTGAAHIAIQAGAPIVPMALAGTRAILPPGSLHLRPGVAELRIGAPIPTSGPRKVSAKDLTERVKQEIARLAALPESSQRKPDTRRTP